MSMFMASILKDLREEGGIKGAGGMTSAWLHEEALEYERRRREQQDQPERRRREEAD